MTILRRPLTVLVLLGVWLLMSKDDNFGCDNPGWTKSQPVLETKK